MWMEPSFMLVSTIISYYLHLHYMDFETLVLRCIFRCDALNHFALLNGKLELRFPCDISQFKPVFRMFVSLLFINFRNESNWITYCGVCQLLYYCPSLFIFFAFDNFNACSWTDSAHIHHPTGDLWVNALINHFH